MALAQFAVVVVAAFTLLFYNQIGLLNSYIALSVILGNIFMIGMITKMSSMLTGKSMELLNELRSMQSPHRRIILVPIREIRIYVGKYYYADPGTMLLTLDIVLGNLINVLLAYR